MAELQTPLPLTPAPAPEPAKPVGPIPNLRTMYPDLSDLNDDDLLKADWRVNFPDLTEEQYHGALLKLYPTPPVKEKNLFEKFAETPAGQVVGGLQEGVNNFGQGLADLSNNVQSENAQMAKDIVLAIPNVLMEDVHKFNKVFYQITQALPPDIREKLPAEMRPSLQEGVEALPNVASNIVGMVAGIKAEQLAAQAGRGLATKMAAGGSVYGGTYEALVGTLKGENPVEVAEKAGTGAIAGGVAGAALGGAARSARAAVRTWMGLPLEETKGFARSVDPTTPSAGRLGVAAAPEPNVRDIPSGPTDAASPAGTGVGPIPIARQPVEPAVGAMPGLAPEPNVLPGQVPGLERAAVPAAPRGPAMELAGRMEQPRPSTGPMVVEGNAPVSGVPAPEPGVIPAANPVVPGLESAIGRISRPPVSPATLDKAVAAHVEGGGSTTNLRTGESMAGSRNIAVSIAPDRTVVIEGPTVTPEILDKFITDNQDLLADPNLMLGTWFDREAGKTYIDVSVAIPKARSAEAVALGKKLNQKAVFDLETFTEIPTGGTGEPLPRGQGIEPAEMGATLQAAREAEVKRAFRPAEFSRAEAAAVDAVPANPSGPGRWREYVTLADKNIAAAKERLTQSRQQKIMDGLMTEDEGWARLLKSEGGYLDPADVRDMAIISSNYMLKGAATVADVTEALVRDFGEEIRPFAERIFEEGKALYEARRPVGNDAVRRVAVDYAEGSGLRIQPIPQEFKRIEPEWARKVAKAYEALPELDEAARNSYRKLMDEVREQYKAITDAGYKIVFDPGDKYGGSSEAMLRDLRENRTLVVSKTPEDFNHPILTPEENDLFRAVHDFFGHAKDGYSFGPDGELNAWRSHGRMFSNKAIPAMSTETVGQNSWVNFGPKSAPGQALRDRPFAQQKGALLPEWVYKELLHEGPKPGLASGRTMQKTAARTIPLPQVATRLTKGVRPVKTAEGAIARAEGDILTNVREYAAGNPQAANWYHDDVAVFRENIQKEFPQTSDPTRMAWFLLETAITSPGKKIADNVAIASVLESAFNKTGKLPILGRLGQELGRNREPIRKANALVTKMDGDLGAVAEYLMTKDEKGEYRAVSEFGPKVGRFWLNLMGVHDEVTVDVWMTRWWRRLMGQPLDKAGAVIDAPVNDAEAKSIRDTVRDLADRVDMAPDALQAVIWDREKKMWRDTGLRDPDDIAFAQASQLVFGNRAKARGEGLSRLGQTELPKAAAAATSESPALKVIKAAKADEGASGGSLWLGPAGESLSAAGRHAKAAERWLKKAGIKVPGEPIGQNVAANQLMQNLGIIRAQTQYGPAAFELSVRPTPQQQEKMFQLVKKHGFGGAQLVGKDGEYGPFFDNNQWGTFMRVLKELPEAS